MVGDCSLITPAIDGTWLIVDPTTADAYRLTDATDTVLQRWLEYSRAHRNTLHDMQGLVATELHRRARLEATR